jgi:hypothetical protein
MHVQMPFCQTNSGVGVWDNIIVFHVWDNIIVFHVWDKIFEITCATKVQ